METLNDYVTKYPFPPITLETIKKGIETIYGLDNLDESDIESMVCTFFILHFEDICKSNIKEDKVGLLLSYSYGNINEPVCESDLITGGDCTKCSSYFLCKQAPEVYHPYEKNNLTESNIYGNNRG